MEFEYRTQVKLEFNYCLKSTRGTVKPYLPRGGGGGGGRRDGGEGGGGVLSQILP